MNMGHGKNKTKPIEGLHGSKGKKSNYVDKLWIQSLKL